MKNGNNHKNSPNNTLGLIATFELPEHLINALKKTLARGYQNVDTYTPFGLDEIKELFKIKEDRWMGLLALSVGGLGGITAFAWQTYQSVFAYPMNTGGRPDFSWPAFIMPTLDFGILCAIVGMFLGMLYLLRLPHYHAPLFRSSTLARASNDRFLLFIQADDPLFDPFSTRTFLEELRPIAIESI